MRQFLLTRPDDPSWILVSIIFDHLLVALARLAIRSGRPWNLQISILRHQIQVLRRHIARPPINDNDQTLIAAIAAIAAALPRRLGQG